jgi:1,4-alpha-glucan branching enzyme
MGTGDMDRAARAEESHDSYRPTAARQRDPACRSRHDAAARLRATEETAVIRLSPTGKTVKVTFALPLGQTAGRCSVVGDFNEWQPDTHPMRRRANGTRSASVTVPRGTSIRFRYLGENGHWFNDPEVAELEGSDSILVV